jgi:hypothetical protein
MEDWSKITRSKLSSNSRQSGIVSLTKGRPSKFDSKKFFSIVRVKFEDWEGIVDD